MSELIEFQNLLNKTVTSLGDLKEDVRELMRKYEITLQYLKGHANRRAINADDVIKVEVAQAILKSIGEL